MCVPRTDFCLSSKPNQTLKNFDWEKENAKEWNSNDEMKMKRKKNRNFFRYVFVIEFQMYEDDKMR